MRLDGRCATCGAVVVCQGTLPERAPDAAVEVYACAGCGEYWLELATGDSAASD